MTKRAKTLFVASVLFLAAGAANSAYAVPTQLNGYYDLECTGGSAQIDVVLAAILGDASGDSSTGSAVSIYCGPDYTDDGLDCNAGGLSDTEASWCAYQHQLDSAADDLEGLCLAYPFNTAPDPEAFCADAAQDWRDTLESVNDDIAGIAAMEVSLSVYGNFWNDFFQVWNSYSTTTLANGAQVATNYIVTPGHLFSANVGPAGSNIGANGGCAGTLAATSEGWFSGSDLRIDNAVGGILICGIGGDGNGIVVALGVSAKMTSGGSKVE